jgi:hypothetical protein
MEPASRELERTEVRLAPAGVTLVPAGGPAVWVVSRTQAADWGVCLGQGPEWVTLAVPVTLVWLSPGSG